MLLIERDVFFPKEINQLREVKLLPAVTEDEDEKEAFFTWGSRPPSSKQRLISFISAQDCGSLLVLAGLPNSSLFRFTVFTTFMQPYLMLCDIVADGGGGEKTEGHFEMDGAKCSCWMEAVLWSAAYGLMGRSVITVARRFVCFLLSCAWLFTVVAGLLVVCWSLPPPLPFSPGLTGPMYVSLIGSVRNLK